MAQLLIGTTSVDVNDVALVAPRGALSTVYLADNSFLESALTPAAQRTAINGTAAGTVLTTAITSTNFGVCYVGAGNVQRIDASADALGCRIELRGGPGPVVCPALTVAAAAILVDAASGAVSSTPGGAWTPAITNGAGTTATSTAEAANYIRSGGAVAAAGDMVFVTALFSVTIAALGTCSFTVAGLPVAANLTSEAPVLEVTRISGDATAPFIFANITGANTVTIAAPGAVTLETVVQIAMHLPYRAA